MILDANLLLYAVDEDSPFHADAAQWLTQTLNGDQRVGIPWQTIGAFVRIATHPRISEAPLSAADAQRFVSSWLAVDVVWVPPATERTARLFNQLARRHHVTGNLVTDAQLAALALEFGLPVASADSDFARFPEIQWFNPLNPPAPQRSPRGT